LTRPIFFSLRLTVMHRVEWSGVGVPARCHGKVLKPFFSLCLAVMHRYAYGRDARATTGYPPVVMEKVLKPFFFSF
jgi:hypothetical protein